MPACPACGADYPNDAAVCPECGADLASRNADEAAAGGVDPSSPLTAENLDAEAERERFERRYGIDIGDRTVDEYLDYLDRQDYSRTPWFWSVVLVEIVGVSLFFATLFWELPIGVGPVILFPATSLLLAVTILVDTRVVGQFGRWSKIRWTYVLSAAVPLIGHITGAFYLILRRLMHEETVEHRRRLLNAGVDIGAIADD